MSNHDIHSFLHDNTFSSFYAEFVNDTKTDDAMFPQFTPRADAPNTQADDAHGTDVPVSADTQVIQIKSPLQDVPPDASFPLDAEHMNASISELLTHVQQVRGDALDAGTSTPKPEAPLPVSAVEVPSPKLHTTEAPQASTQTHHDFASRNEFEALQHTVSRLQRELDLMRKELTELQHDAAETQAHTPVQVNDLLTEYTELHERTSYAPASSSAEPSSSNGNAHVASHLQPLISPEEYGALHARKAPPTHTHKLSADQVRELVEQSISLLQRAVHSLSDAELQDVITDEDVRLYRQLFT